MKSSRRDRAIEYAKGIAKPQLSNLKYNNKNQQPDGYGDDEGVYQDESLYYDNSQAHEHDGNYNEYLSEIDKIKAMFN